MNVRRTFQTFPVIFQHPTLGKSSAPATNSLAGETNEGVRRREVQPSAVRSDRLRRRGRVEPTAPLCLTHRLLGQHAVGVEGDLLRGAERFDAAGGEQLREEGLGRPEILEVLGVPDA